MSRSKWLRTCWGWSAPELCWWRWTGSQRCRPARPAKPGREPALCRSGAPPRRRPWPPGRVLCCLEQWSFLGGSICRCTPWCWRNRELERSARLTGGGGGAPGGCTSQTLQKKNKKTHKLVEWISKHHISWTFSKCFLKGKVPGSSSLCSNSILDITAWALGAWMMSTTEPEQHNTQPSFPSRFKCSFKIQEASRALHVNKEEFYITERPRQINFTSVSEFRF